MIVRQRALKGYFIIFRANVELRVRDAARSEGASGYYDGGPPTEEPGPPRQDQ